MSETACINDHIKDKVQEIFMLREFMVVNNITAAMSESLKVPAQQLYDTDDKFRGLINGLTAGFMRLFVENTFPIPPDKVTVFCPVGPLEHAVRVALAGSDLKLIHEADRKGGKVLGYR